MSLDNKLIPLWIGTVSLVLMTGCVGHNTVLFATKSNAGLDFDSKPPTAEINISRKEGVVEPAFEGGKAPPVMASFSSKVGSGGGVGRFFFGVDQTFAGGDAAVTMSKLYDQNTPVAETEENAQRFDSGVTLSKLPNANSSAGKGWLRWKKVLFGLPEPGEVRPFFFGTDSQLGIKIAWDGVGGPYPDTIKIGFNRKELAIAPVTVTPGNTPGNGGANIVRIPSFLATVDSDVEGTNDVALSWMQYFATGESASFLARQYGVRKAMLERADPKAAAASIRAFQSRQTTDYNAIKTVISIWEADSTKHPYILARAYSDGLVPLDTAETDFVSALVAGANPNDPSQTAKFADLATFVAQSLSTPPPATTPRTAVTTDPNSANNGVLPASTNSPIPAPLPAPTSH